MRGALQMKRVFTLLLALVLVSSAIPIGPALADGSTAYPSTQQVNVDGTVVEFQMYALRDANGNPTNYVKVRDLALALNGTKAQFSVEWNGAVDLVAGAAYTPDGSENATPFSGERTYSVPTNPTNVNGSASSLGAIFLTDDNGGGYTYYKLRDLGAALGFTVDWSAEKGVFVETAAPAPEAEAVYPVALYAPDGRTCEVPSNQAEAYLAAGWYHTPMTTLYAADGSTQIVPTSEADAYVAAGLHRSLDDIKVTLYEPYGNTLSVMPNEVDSYLSVGWYRSASEAAAHAVPFDPSSLKLESVIVSLYKYRSDNDQTIGLHFKYSGSVPLRFGSTLWYGGYDFENYKDTTSSTGSFRSYRGWGYSEKIAPIAATLRNSGSGYTYFFANKVKYKVSFTVTGHDSEDFTYSITKLGD